MFGESSRQRRPRLIRVRDRPQTQPPLLESAEHRRRLRIDGVADPGRQYRVAHLAQERFGDAEAQAGEALPEYLFRRQLLRLAL